MEQKRLYKVVLTGGPCGGKTTGQTRLCTFFENMGWKVFRVPETATVLLSGGIKFSDLNAEEGKSISTFHFLAISSFSSDPNSRTWPDLERHPKLPVSIMHLFAHLLRLTTTSLATT
ncbi:hypothetical protein K0M31_011946 [Melipona bicolor]|uniref:NadR/Ttd14 AAA domain-containing protein n=1 Tax=Melipona bicolor TaxID=60889 RepID=A0AA40KVD3_9HYME|nr:hypothetical protein K0M31_011946 [Melipona bicolor]